MSIFRMNLLKCIFQANVNLRHKPILFNLKQYHKTIVTGNKITIDITSKKLTKSENPAFDSQEILKSPKKLLGSPTVLHHLQWMLKQDSLNRDMLLIGHPGPMLHWIFFQFSNLTQRKLEYATLGRDTGKGDKNNDGFLQQSTMHDGAQLEDIVERAAVHGSILVIKGIEQIERNIVPALNNLLENREMHLQDGRKLISHQSYDKLQAKHGRKEIEQRRLVRVSEKFRVIAVGSSNSSSLNPLLRSRFQARDTIQELEEIRFYKNLLLKLTKDETRNEIKLPLTLNHEQQKKLHNYAKSIGGLEMESSDKGNDGYTLVYKKLATPTVKNQLRQLEPTPNETPHLRLKSESTIDAISTLVKDESICNEEERCTNFESIESQSSDSQLPPMYSNTKPTIELTIPPLIEPIDEIKAIRESLPIYEYRDKILDAIGNHQVIVISGETGSGKTTQVPQYIMEQCTTNQQECRIICTQPRRMAATSIASRISQERNDRLGRSVGYQIRFDSRVIPTTNLILTTSGFLLRCLTGSKQEDVYKNLTHLIIDEVHEREKVTDFLLIAIRDALRVNPHLKVILMSATLDAELFSQYFGNCPVINVPGRLFDVEIMHLDDVLRKTGYRTKDMQDFVAKKLLITNNQPQIDHELLQHVIMHIHKHNSTDGSILVFLPGYEDIMIQKRMIETQFPAENYELFVLHSGVNRSNNPQHERIYDRMPPGIRKIILSTNIAETSLTIKDVVHVIDAGKVKQQTYDFTTDTTSLTSTDISQACAKQRAGRAGRIQNGFCYRLYSLEQFEAMDKYTLPEILRVPLTEICLNAKILAGNLSIEEFLLKALQPPPVPNIRQSIDLLKKIDALDANENITDLGIHLANMPVDCQLGRAVLYAIMLRCLDPIVTIVSALSVKEPFTLPTGNEGELKNKIKREFAQNSMSDHQMLLNAFNEWSDHENKVDFCVENFISNENMKMIADLRRLIMRHLYTADLIKDDFHLETLNENSDKWEIVKACLTAGFYPNICRISKENGRIFSKQDKRIEPQSSSILHGSRANGHIDLNVFRAGAEWLVYGNKSRISRLSLLRNITVVPAIDVILFGGPINLPENYISPPNDNGEIVFRIDDWISFIVNQNEANLLFQLRSMFSSMFSRFLQNHRTFQPENKEIRMLEVLITVIQQEDTIEQRIKAAMANDEVER